MRRSLEREKEFSYKILSEACAKREGYDPQTTRRVLSGSVTVRCPAITPHDWQLDRRSTHTGTRRDCYRWHQFWENSASAPGTDLRLDPPGNLAAQRARVRSCMTRARTLETMNFNTMLLCVGPVLCHTTQIACHDRQQRYVERPPRLEKVPLKNVRQPSLYALEFAYGIHRT